MLYMERVLLLAFMLKPGIGSTENVVLNRHVFMQIFDDFDRLFRPRQIYMLIDPKQNKTEAQTVMDIMKSKVGKDFVGTICIDSTVAKLASRVIDSKAGAVMIISVTNRESVAQAVRQVSYELSDIH